MDKQMEETLKAQIAAETDPEQKEMFAMMYFGILYTNYIKENDPQLHERAVRYAAETHELDGVEFAAEADANNTQFRATDGE